MVAAISLALGVLVGQNIDKIKGLIRSNPLSPALVCEYGEKKYKSGESFKATDGCNSCGCNNGEVACTLMACDVK